MIMFNPTLSFFFLILPIFFHGARSSLFTFKNKCPYTVWPANVNGLGAPLSSTGFELPTNTANVLIVKQPWSGRIWGRTGCTNTDGKFTCFTGNCPSGQIGCNGLPNSPPMSSLAEFSLGVNNGPDYYDISIVDGFNLPLAITPTGGLGSCANITCPVDINKKCPQELKVIVGGAVVACKNACVAFKEPKYCCTGDFNSPEKCPPSNYSKYFESQCPQALSYAYDDRSSTATCSGEINYKITFCP